MSVLPQERRLNSSYEKPATADISSILAKPSWSVRSLLPDPDAAAKTPRITSKQLHHLLRLSALPPPKSPEEEDKMLQTLSSQLHFVKEIQSVETTGVEPLRSLRDETPEAQDESAITPESFKHLFENEEVRGMSGRIRRKKGPPSGINEVEDWDIMGQASRKVGRYLVVESSKR